MNAFEKWLLWTSTALVAVSGIVYGWMKYFLAPADPFSAVGHPLQPFFLKLHVLSSPVLVFAVGVVFTRHIWRQYRSRLQDGRRSGLSLLLTFVPMVASGYLVQVVTARTALWWVIAVHLAASAIYLAGFLTHQVVVSIRERRREHAVAQELPHSG